MPDVKKFIDELRVTAREKFIPVMREKTTELLARLTATLRPETCLEIGTCLGVSGITVLSNGGKRLTTVEIDGERLYEAEKNFTACGVRSRVELIEGDCFEQLKFLADNRYDLIVLDGPKGHYDALYRQLMPMLNIGGVLFADDIDFYGLTAGDGKPLHKHRTIVGGMREFIRLAKTDENVKAEFYDVEDGVAVITKLTDSKTEN